MWFNSNFNFFAKKNNKNSLAASFEQAFKSQSSVDHAISGKVLENIFRLTKKINKTKLKHRTITRRLRSRCRCYDCCGQCLQFQTHCRSAGYSFFVWHIHYIEWSINISGLSTLPPRYAVDELRLMLEFLYSGSIFFFLLFDSWFN